ncbi:MAG: tetratricopeptide repeat protein [Solirubrobacterales bacterium]
MMDDAKTNEIEKHKRTQHYEVLRELGDCYTSIGKYSQAHHCYEKAASLGPDEPGPYIGLGVAALQMDKPDDAEIAFRVACRLDPRCAKAYAGLAMLAQQRGEYLQSFDLYMKSLELDTDNISALLGLFQVSCEMGSFAKVIYYLDVYLQMHPGDISVMFALGALYLKDGQLDRSKDMLLNLLALEPTNRDAANLLEEVEHTLVGMGTR